MSIKVMGKVKAKAMASKAPLFQISLLSTILTGCVLPENKQFFEKKDMPDFDELSFDHGDALPGESSESEGAQTGNSSGGESTNTENGNGGVIELGQNPDPSSTPGIEASPSPEAEPSSTPVAEVSPSPEPSGTPIVVVSPSPSPAGTPVVIATPTPVPSSTPVVSSSTAQESFVVARKSVKKLDFLFVVDNSGSMADNQDKLAAGFEAFANTYFRRADLDICITIITTDRYLGRTSSRGYERERKIQCTKPASENGWNQAQSDAYIQHVINDFKARVKVGTNGSSQELAGKSLVAFLYNLNRWGDPIKANVRNNFFRSDAVANITFLSDENNWYTEPTINEQINDIPAVQGAAIHNKKNSYDNRKGIKNYLDEYFNELNPNGGVSYSVTSFIQMNGRIEGVPSQSMNIGPLAGLIGRESSLADINGSAATYANVYRNIGDNLALRANAFNLTHNIYEPLFPQLIDLNVNYVRADGSTATLSYGSDYTVMMPNGVVINESISNMAGVGDRVNVDYRYLNQ